MPTFLFDSIIFGPVHSRRLGVSLGINLLPVNGKICNFDCLYCECGLNKGQKKGHLPNRTQVFEALKEKLEQMLLAGEAPDVLTFAGNGEPTLHPFFGDIIDDTISLRNALFPKARICVLSNATTLDKPEIIRALEKIDQPVLKLDSAFIETINLINRPVSSTFSIEKLVDQFKVFNGNLIIQTLFTRGQFKDIAFDNTTEVEIDAWVNLIAEIAPKSVMIYTIDRDTPIEGIVRVSYKELKIIANKLIKKTGIAVSISS